MTGVQACALPIWISRGRKLVHQLSSTSDPIFSLTVPASRIVGGYSIENGTIVPRYSHGTVIEAVFRRTRVTVGLMTAAKLLSAVEPVLRYQRTRFRGGASITPGTPRYELGLQQREDVVHRLVDIWTWKFLDHGYKREAIFLHKLGYEYPLFLR